MKRITRLKANHIEMYIDLFYQSDKRWCHWSIYNKIWTRRIIQDFTPLWCYWVHISVTMLLCWFTLKEHRDCRSFEAKKRFFQTLLEVQDNHLILNPFLNSFSTFTDLNIHPKQILLLPPFIFVFYVTASHVFRSKWFLYHVKRI